jgi:hypothetical protein
MRNEIDREALFNRIGGMLMHLYGLVQDANIRQAIRATIDELNDYGEQLDNEEADREDQRYRAMEGE